ncbi:PKD-like domain-containing protein, partial [Lutibacter sp. TH_r2]|uniref:PKD-like domain-containing protein n=1 Tax=Lutibacter sp. TH_r2 TaxID=3082083 RepID=UPI0029539ECC
MNLKHYSKINLKIVILLGFLLVGVKGFSQIGVQEASIRTGVTFQWEDTQSVDEDPATIKSFTIDGVLYDQFAVPSYYQLTRVGTTGGHGSNGIIDGNTPESPTTSSTATDDIYDSNTWDTAALSAFQDKDLNHYFTANPNGTNFNNDFDAVAVDTTAQIQAIYYDPAIPSNTGGILAVTERGGNNSYYVELWGIPAAGGSEQKLGDTFVRTGGNLTTANVTAPVTNSDYWSSGRQHYNRQSIAIALFELSEIAPTGSQITEIKFVGATRDHGDGKFFILQKYAQEQTGSTIENQTLNGQLDNSSTTPIGSTYSLVEDTIDPNDDVSVTVNMDGSFELIPKDDFVGVYTFTYQICLPEPNEGICDTATVTVYVDSEPEITTEDVCYEEDVIFNITGTSGNIITYSGASSGTVILNDSGEATVTVEDAISDATLTIDSVKNIYSGNSTSVSNISATAVVNPNTEITTQPTSSSTYCAGDTATALSVTASGTGTLSYQWYSNTTNSTTGGTAVGTNSLSYIPDVSSVGTTYYYVEVTGVCLNVTSSIATVVVNPNTAITTQPTNPSAVCAGSTVADLTVGASGTGAVSYQWYSNTSANTTDGTLISGATSATYTPDGSTAGTFYYYAVASSDCSTATSNVATVTVNSVPQGTNDEYTIDSGNTLNDDLSNNVDLTGVEFSWQAVDNVNIVGETTTVSTASNITDTLTNLTGTVQQVVYTVTPTSIDDCAGIAFTVKVNVNPKLPTISINDQLNIEEGNTATFVVELSNTYIYPVTFTVNTVDGSAVSPGDYVAITNAIYTIPANSTTVNIPVTINTDNVYEQTNETYQVVLSNVNIETINLEITDTDLIGDGSIIDLTAAPTVSVVASTPDAAEPGTDGAF